MLLLLAVCFFWNHPVYRFSPENNTLFATCNSTFPTLFTPHFPANSHSGKFSCNFPSKFTVEFLSVFYGYKFAKSVYNEIWAHKMFGSGIIKHFLIFGWNFPEISVYFYTSLAVLEGGIPIQSIRWAQVNNNKIYIIGFQRMQNLQTPFSINSKISTLCFHR